MLPPMCAPAAGICSLLNGSRGCPSRGQSRSSVRWAHSPERSLKRPHVRLIVRASDCRTHQNSSCVAGPSVSLSTRAKALRHPEHDRGRPSRRVPSSTAPTLAQPVPRLVHWCTNDCSASSTTTPTSPAGGHRATRATCASSIFHLVVAALAPSGGARARGAGHAPGCSIALPLDDRARNAHLGGGVFGTLTLRPPADPRLPMIMIRRAARLLPFAGSFRSAPVARRRQVGSQGHVAVRLRPTEYGLSVPGPSWR